MLDLKWIVERESAVTGAGAEERLVAAWIDSLTEISWAAAYQHQAILSYTHT